MIWSTICCFFAWMMMAMILMSVFNAITNIITQSQKLHQIPCSSCQFFTKDYRLKCAVQPTIALSEAAINCRDYEVISKC